MKRTLALAAAALAAVTLVAAGCGGSDEVPADAVAVVDGASITRASLDDLLARAKKSYTAQKRAFPKAGTSEYQALQTQAVAYLVQRQEYATEADKLGVEVTDAQIAKKIAEVQASSTSAGARRSSRRASPTRATPRRACARTSARSS